MTEFVTLLNDGVSAAGLFGSALKTLGVEASDVSGALAAIVAATPGLNVAVGSLKALKAAQDALAAGPDPLAGTGITGAPGAPRGGAGAAAAAAAKVEKAKADTAAGIISPREQTLLLQQARATLNNYLSDDLKVAKQIVDLRKDQLRNAKPKERFDAEQALVAAQQDLYSVQTAIANNATAQTKKTTTALKSAQLDRIQDTARRDAARAGLQFQALGLTADGTAKIPGVANLRKQLGTLTDRVKGTPLDTAKTRTQLQRIAKVLSGQFGKVGDDVRSAIVGMFDTIRDALKDNKVDLGGELTKTTSLNSKRIIEGLGLDASTAKEIRARLSRFNTAGRALAGTAGSTITAPTVPVAHFGADGAPPFVVESYVTVNLDGDLVARTVTRSQQKNARRNPKQKRGANIL
jgi:hypothetical protein